MVKLILFIFSTLVRPNKINNHAKFQRCSSNRVGVMIFLVKITYIQTDRKLSTVDPCLYCEKRLSRPKEQFLTFQWWHRGVFLRVLSFFTATIVPYYLQSPN